jgi:hypothetical protein
LEQDWQVVVGKATPHATRFIPATFHQYRPYFSKKFLHECLPLFFVQVSQ